MSQEELPKKTRGRPRKYPVEEKKAREVKAPLTNAEYVRRWRERHPEAYENEKKAEILRQRGRRAKQKEAKRQA
jgi:hypothetical protein